MKWFGNRNREGKETKNIDVNPRNQILQTSLDKPTKQEKGKLDRFEDQTPEEQKKRLDNAFNASQAVKNRSKLDKPSTTSSEEDPSIDQLEKMKKNDQKNKLDVR